MTKLAESEIGRVVAYERNNFVYGPVVPIVVVSGEECINERRWPEPGDVLEGPEIGIIGTQQPNAVSFWHSAHRYQHSCVC